MFFWELCFLEALRFFVFLQYKLYAIAIDISFFCRPRLKRKVQFKINETERINVRKMAVRILRLSVKALWSKVARSANNFISWIVIKNGKGKISNFVGIVLFRIQYVFRFKISVNYSFDPQKLKCVQHVNQKLDFVFDGEELWLLDFVE